MISTAPGSSSSSASASSHRPSQPTSSTSSSSRPPPPAPSMSSSSSASTSTPTPAPRPRNSTRQFEYTRESPNPWHITSQHLNSSPSLADGMTPEQLAFARAETADFISQMGQQCKITQWAIATGSVYLHVFFTRFSFRRFDPFEVAATCLFLAGKVEERRTRVDQVINSYYHVRLNPPSSGASSSSSSSWSASIHLLPPSPSSPEYEALRQRIYSLEFVLLDAIEFVFEVSHPYPNLMAYLRETIYGPKYANKPSAFISKETQEKGGLAQIAWLFINDSLRSTLCLEYPPDVICVAVIALSIKYKQMDEPMRAGPCVITAKPWHEELFGVDKRTIDLISDVILTCVEQRYKPDPAQAQALLGVTPPLHTALPVTSLPTFPSTASQHRPRPPPPGAPNHRPSAPPSRDPRDRNPHLQHLPAPVLDPAHAGAPQPFERSVPRAPQGVTGPGAPAGGVPAGGAPAARQRGRFPVPSQPHAADHNASRPAPIQPARPTPPAAAQAKPAAAAAPASAAAAPKRGGYVWKPPAKSRRPVAPAAEEAEQKPAAPTRPISPMTPPSPFLQQVSPSSRPPSPFLQSPSSASKRKRDEGALASTAATPSTASSAVAGATRKRPHSPSPPRPLPPLGATGGLARFDSHGQTESSLVEQIVVHMRFQSAAAADSNDLEEGEVGPFDKEGVSGFDAAAMKALPEQKESEGGGVMEAYILQGLDRMKAGLKSEKREDAEVMEDISKMREEMDGEGPVLRPRPAAPRADDDEEDELRAADDGNTTDHDTAGDADGDGDGDGDCRVWKRARREMAEGGGHSPASCTGFEGVRREGEDEGSDFDVSAPSSPHGPEGGGDDAGLHHAAAFDSFSAVKPHSHREEAFDEAQDKTDVEGAQEQSVAGVAEHSTLLSV